MGLVKILLLGDTHLGFDLPFRPRIQRRRRGQDFFANFQTALRPALEGEVDFVVHGGDLLFRSRVPAELVAMAFEPLKRVADAGVPVVLVPGNHERSRIPARLLAVHPLIHIFDEPGTFVAEARGMRVAFGGFPYFRQGVRRHFGGLVAQTGLLAQNADVRLLCMHHCFEGSTVGPNDFVFRGAPDVVRAADVPMGLAALLSGHIHRFQVLRRALNGGLLAAPVFYPGSVERTSFAEMGERKGYLVLEVAADGPPGGRVVRWQFRELPARPMVVKELQADGDGPHELNGKVLSAIAAAPPDAVLKMRIFGRPREEALALVSAPRLRGMAPPTMNVSVSLMDYPRNGRPARPNVG
ncbi:MAG: metallophosphoesterase [bacterium]